MTETQQKLADIAFEDWLSKQSKPVQQNIKDTKERDSSKSFTYNACMFMYERANQDREELVLTQADVKRLETSLGSGTILAPSNMNSEEKIEFIVSHSDTVEIPLRGGKTIRVPKGLSEQETNDYIEKALS
jgi:hypothetical protein